MGVALSLKFALDARYDGGDAHPDDKLVLSEPPVRLSQDRDSCHVCHCGTSEICLDLPGREPLKIQSTVLYDMQNHVCSSYI